VLAFAFVFAFASRSSVF